MGSSIVLHNCAGRTARNFNGSDAVETIKSVFSPVEVNDCCHCFTCDMIISLPQIILVIITSRSKRLTFALILIGNGAAERERSPQTEHVKKANQVSSCCSNNSLLSKFRVVS